jgi:putative CocE/NonD family hydrolase
MWKKIILAIFAILIIGAGGLLLWANAYPDLNETETAGGLPRNHSQYLTMRDGVDIAVEVWLPADLTAEAQVPTLIQATRYSRASLAYDLTLVDKLRIRLGDVDERQVPYTLLKPEATWANAAGYAVVFVDARGSAASFGTRPIEWSPDEIADYGEVIAWVSEQPWSNGKVGAWGTSYPGNTAEMMVSTGAPALLAVAPRFSDFDPLQGVGMPGGLRADGFLDQWSELNAAMDGVPQMAKPVTADTDGSLRDTAVAGHNNPNIAAAMRDIEYRDDTFAQSGLTFAAASPYHYQEAIEANSVPMQVWVSWLDAGTTDGALSRFLTFSNPQQVIIGAWSHGGGVNVDPYRAESLPADNIEADLATAAAMQPQMAQVLEFFDCILKENECAPLETTITYYTLNSGEWRTTTVWPPAGLTPQRYYFAADGVLSPDAPTADGADDYTVDFSATTGTSNRWFAQSDTPIDYTADRAAADANLLTYTSAPLASDVEITGSPVITFYVASTMADGAFHVYLEDVAPDGRVTYITEGVLRAIHHPLSDAEPPFVELGPYRSFNRADAAPLVPGEVTEIVLNLYATSVLVEEGHSLRVALAGADADTFARYPAEGTPVWTVQRSAVYPSHITLPMVER